MARVASPERVDSSGLDESLIQVIGGLTEGDLVFPFPFDLRSAVALLENDLAGDVALNVFDAYRDRVRVQYHVRIVAETPDHPEVGAREVIDTRVNDARTLAALIGGLFLELRRRDEDEGTALPA